MTIEVFTWNRAKFLYNKAKVEGKDPEMEVFHWLLAECKVSNSSDAITIATSPRLKHEKID